MFPKAEGWEKRKGLSALSGADHVIKLPRRLWLVTLLLGFIWHPTVQHRHEIFLLYRLADVTVHARAQAAFLIPRIT